MSKRHFRILLAILMAGGFSTLFMALGLNMTIPLDLALGVAAVMLAYGIVWIPEK